MIIPPHTSNFSINTILNSKTLKQGRKEEEIGESIDLPLE